ncbi:MAG: PAS domain-containing sensor histidine kinase, partial [Flavobacteriales bacterium]|nr:PAS domain-containing sensor histidine kinase [Flavobacteriales bacterium]MDW8410321.1 PAS domain S-box protein [Flavobacteriales bacterium]
GKRSETEILFTTSSGKQKWLAVTTVPVMENGHCKKLFGIIQDIHEKKLKELEYQKSEIRFRTIVDSAPGVIFVTNTKGEITYISQNVKNYYEFKAEDLVGKQLLNFVHKDFQDSIRELFSKLKTHRCMVETPPHKVKAKGGGFRWTKTSMAPLIGANGELEAVLGMAMDITEIKKIEEALEKANAEAKKLASYYKSLVENQSVYVIKLDEKGRIIFANDLFTNDFVPPILSGPPSIKKFIGYTEGAQLMEMLTKMFEGNPSAETVTLEVFSENKKIKKFIQWEFRLTTDDRSEKTIIMGFGYDVTELMKAYEKTKELLHLTEEQNLRLQNFAYIISHNIRSHYANMQGLMNLYQMSLDPKEKENYLDLIAKAINNLGITIEDLNQILNIKKEFPQPSVPVNLKDEINIIKDTLIHEIVETGARVELYVPHNIKVNVVPAYLNSILLNLFTNALKYRSPERPLVIEIHATKSGNRTIIKFKDNGLGIDLKRAKNKIFGLYKTFHNHPQARGFGLFITKTQVEAMGGSISVESEPNIGTTFILELPS